MCTVPRVVHGTIKAIYTSIVQPLIPILTLIFTIPTHQLLLQERREKDEFKITELKMEIRRLDQELAQEIKRRVEMNKSTQAVRK